MRDDTDPDGEHQASPLPLPTNDVRNSTFRPRFRTALALSFAHDLLSILTECSPAPGNLSILSEYVNGPFLIRDENEID